MLLSSREVGCVHLAYHAADSETLHVVVIKGYKGASVHNYSKEIDPVALLRDIITSKYQITKFTGENICLR